MMGTETDRQTRVSIDTWTNSLTRQPSARPRFSLTQQRADNVEDGSREHAGEKLDLYSFLVKWL